MVGRLELMASLVSWGTLSLCKSTTELPISPAAAQAMELQKKNFIPQLRSVGLGYSVGYLPI